MEKGYLLALIAGCRSEVAEQGKVKTFTAGLRDGRFSDYENRTLQWIQGATICAFLTIA